MTTEAADKAREKRSRRQLARRACRLEKSRVREPNLDNHGGYMVVDTRLNAAIVGLRWDWTLDDIEAWLAVGEPRDAVTVGREPSPG